MYIKEIIVDGFKSYAQRTVIAGFDPLFNAITGLNGSGKSNILDSICFLLGITNLTQVRAGNLQELVYKQGQAGVTKATVTITFDNSDKAQSPVGYQQYDEITVTRMVVIGGRNKYLINGVTAQPGRVQNLFHSVQLNVNNPHFLIMQGRITKVLNMKPPEILSMIEEAAGTRMFETKKLSALKTIEKKDNKLQEITTVLTEDITPTLEKLRKERSSYLEFQKTKTEVGHLTRFVVAFNYTECEEKLKKCTEELAQHEEKINELKSTVQKCDSEAANLKINISVIEKRRDSEMGDTLDNLEKDVAKFSKDLVQANTKLTHKKEERQAEEKAKKAAQNSIKEAEKAIADKEKEASKAEKELEKELGSYEAKQAALADAERRFHAVTTGMSSVDGNDKSLGEQLKDLRNEVSTAATEMQQTKMKQKHLADELKKKKPQAKANEKEYTKMQSSLETQQKEISKIEADIKNLKCDDSTEEKLQQRKQAVGRQVNALRDEVDSLQAKLSNLQFTYSDPVKGFDRSKVSGLVAELVDVKQPAAMTALEITAGGKLYNVVVDNEVTGKQLLEKGRLKRRVTIIPLNKIAARTIDSKVVAAAKKEVGPDNVDLALSLVGYPEEVDAAMKYVFGSTFICKDQDSARRVTFNEATKARSVTLEGDVFDPAGTLTGGSSANSAPVLAMLQTLKQKQSTLRELEAELRDITHELSTLARDLAKYAKLKSMLELKQHEVDLLRTQIEQSTVHQIIAEVRGIETALEESEAALAAAQAKEKEAKKKVAEMEKEIKQYTDQREDMLKQAEKAKAAAKAEIEKVQGKMDSAKGHVEELKLEAESLRVELKGIGEQIAVHEQAIIALMAEEDSLSDAVAERKQLYDAANQELNKKRSALSKYDKEIKELSAEISHLEKEKHTAELDIKKTNHKLSDLQAERKAAARAVDSLLAEHEWIKSEKQYFGVPGTAFEFKKGDGANDPQNARRRLAELKTVQERLSKSVNMKVLSMFDKAEKEYNDLLQKKKIVEEDKHKIEHAIKELDEKKNEALNKAHAQVNKDFGSIFGTLLPGTTAKLEAERDGSVLTGLQIKVAFGKQWKESLTELSGGQRSLVALSLILSLLLFKPAPLYILDEVDAALDLSHTQNIGNMLRTHFNKSQFIVVSLKDGMFNNANVLFKTKFVDGVSTVKRYSQQQTSSSEEESKENRAAGKKTKNAGKPLAPRSLPV